MVNFFVDLYSRKFIKSCHELDDYCKFLGKDLLETDLFERSMVAQDEALTRILQLNKKFDTVMVYPAFGNEVSKTKYRTRAIISRSHL